MNSKVSRWQSLKTRATVFTLAVFVVSIWSLSFYSTRLLQADMERVLGQQQFSTASVIAHEINDRLSDRLQALESIAKDMDAGVMSQPGALQIRLEQQPLLQVLFNGGVFITGADGTAMADVPLSNGRIGINYMDRESVAIPLKEGKMVIGRPAMGKKLGAPIFSMVAPIRDTQGKVIGSLVGTINLGKPNFLDQIAQSHYGNTGGFLLISKQHRLVITATDKSRIMEPLPAAGINASIDRFANGYEGSAVLTNPRGVEVLVSGKGIPIAGWYALASLPTSEAFAPVRDLQQRMLWATLLLTLLTGALTWWILSRQLAPLVATADALATLADAKQLAQPLPATRADEIGHLVDGFNRILARWTQREAALQDSQQNLAITLNSMGDAVMAADAAGLVTRMNPAAERLTGWLLPDALGRPLTEVFCIVNATTRQPVTDPVQRVIERGAVVGLANHTLLLAKDGQQYQIADSAAPIRNAAGNIVGVVLVFSDVTEKYQAEQALLETEWKFRALFEKGPIGVAYHEMIYDAAGQPKDYRFIDANATFQELTGVNPNGKTVTQAFPGIENDPFDWIGTYARVARNGEPIRFEQFFPTNGCWYDCVAYQYKPDGFVVAFLNITKRKQTEDALIASEARLQNLLRDIPLVAVQGYSEDGIARYWNPASENLYGYSAAEAIGRSLLDTIIPVEMHDGVRQAMQEMFETAQPIPAGELSLRRKDGSRVEVFSSHAYVKVPGQAPEMFCLDVDITERKQAEEALRIAATAFEAQQGMVITDAQRMILRVNKAFSTITGYSVEEAVGQYPRILKSGRHDSMFYAAMTQALEQKGAWAGEIWNRRKNGQIYPEWLSISAVKDAAGLTSHFVAIFSDISERIKAQAQIDNLAFYDPLTQLPNRRLLLNRLEQALHVSTRHARKNALLFVDLDNFKTLNDTLGHHQGDLLLKQVAQRLKTCIREGDTVAHLGSDEFVVMLEDLSEDDIEAATQAETVGDNVLKVFQQDFSLDQVCHHATSSIGITLFGGPLLLSSEQPLRHAELAMFQAKAAGRNTLRFFDARMQAQVSAHAALEADLREAVLQQQFLLHYQPQVVGAGRITGVEALVRWQHPQRGSVSPAEFIPLAEESGLILPIGQWVLDAACAQLAAWAQQPDLAHLSVAVNVSARQFKQVDFVDKVLEALERNHARPKLLKLELTESMLVDDVEAVIAKMGALKTHGVTFSLDDFGTGYSSLAYLKRLPLDQLKIDQGFVRNIVTDTNDAAIAKMVVALAESMGLSVIAEGVELQAQADFLAHQGCHAYQGYLFSRPLPLAALEAFARGH